MRVELLPADSLAGLIAGTVANGTYTVELYAPAAGTINQLKTQLSAGTATVKLQIDGVDVTGSSSSATTSIVTGTCTAANTVSAGSKITMVVSAVSSAADLAFSIKVTLT
jgi:hypothetical protein